MKKLNKKRVSTFLSNNVFKLGYFVTLLLCYAATSKAQNTLSPQMVNTAGGSGVVAGTYYDYTVGEPITLFGGIPTGCDSIFSGFQHCAIDTLRTNKASVALSGATNFCLGSNVVLTAPTGASWLWSNSATTQTISATISGNYHVRTTNSCGDTIGSNNVTVTTINPQTPNICLVTTDSVTNYNYNTIYWDNSQYSRVDSFIVYRYESGPYVRIGAVSKDSSRLMDTARHVMGIHDGDPNYTSYKYTLAIKDSCGNISAQSPRHETVFMQNQNNGNFNINQYVIGAGQTNPVTGYDLYKDPTGIGNSYTYLTTISGTSGTDPSYSSSASYRIDINGFNCISNQRLASGGHNSTDATRVKSHSNTNRQAGQTTNIHQLSANNYQVTVYPNPSNGMFNIQLSNYENASVEVYNAIGQKVLVQTLQTNISQLNLVDFSNGMYQLRVLKNNTTVYQTKVSKVD